jgi:hypothetical protein
MAYQVISPLMNHFLANNMAKDYTSVRGEKSMFVQLTPPDLAQYDQPMYFDSNTMLNGNNAIITGIEIILPTQLTTTPNGLTPLDGEGGVFRYAILNILDIKNDVIAQLPLQSLITNNANNAKIKFTYFDKQLWSNCFVSFAQAPFSSPLEPLMFNIYYNPLQKD